MSFAPAEIDEALRPEIAKAPEVAVKLKDPLAKVKLFEAVRVCVEVKEPLLVVVTPVAPIAIDAVFDVPILTDPLAVPVPPWMLTEPPVDVPPDSLPPNRLSAPPVPEEVLFVADCKVKELPPVIVVMSGEAFPATAKMPF
jgi:hypothetical protein